MCTTCSECVTDVYIGVKTHLGNVHTLPRTSAQNTCSKVHVTSLQAVHIRAHHIRVHMHTHEHGCVRAPKTPPDTPRRRHQDLPSAHTCAHACACIHVRMYAYTGARAYTCTRTHARRMHMYAYTSTHMRMWMCIRTHANTPGTTAPERQGDELM